MFLQYPLDGTNEAVPDGQNFSFEQCLLYWTPDQTGWICTNQPTPYHGLWAAAWAPHLSNVNSATLYSDTLFPIAAGASATVSGVISSNGACGIYSGRISIEWRNGGANNGFTEGPIIRMTRGTWINSTITGVAPAGTTHAKIICRANYDPQLGRCGFVAFDDCRFAYG